MSVIGQAIYVHDMQSGKGERVGEYMGRGVGAAIPLNPPKRGARWIIKLPPCPLLLVRILYLEKIFGKISGNISVALRSDYRSSANN